METRLTIPNDMAAEIAENTKVELERFLTEAKYKIRPAMLNSFQDLTYWLLIAEANDITN